ncbi:MAG: 1-acyl-sn-glycerol-3-phosphate acyltransferase [Bacteroidetes Order II. Incertae sedis bacterium]|nr:1-acyl-sn-glycerol-3-phosphate acyltransferase [Bacteroidetes Order II. bacterium]
MNVPTSAVPKRTSEDVLKPSFKTGCWTVWILFSGSLYTIFCCTAVLVHSLLKPGLAIFHRWSRRWGRGMLALMGIRTHVALPFALDPTKPYIFLANHQNVLDIFVSTGFIPVPFGFLAKVELKTAPFIGWVLQRFCVFVDRSTPRKAVESIRQAGKMVREGHAIMVYPEGERTWSNQMVPFMRGAFEVAIEAGVPIIPMSFVGFYACADERRYLVSPGEVRVIFHPAIETNGFTRKDIPALMETVFGIIQCGQEAAERQN